MKVVYSVLLHAKATMSSSPFHKHQDERMLARFEFVEQECGLIDKFINSHFLHNAEVVFLLQFYVGI